MPVRRKADRRRATFLFKDWEEYLSSGIDMFSDLRGLVPTDAHGNPPREIAVDAWRALGAQIVQEYGPDCWGAREFGNAGS